MIREERVSAARTTRVFGGFLLVMLSVLLCGSIPSASAVRSEPAKNTQHRQESQFAIATVNDARADQRSQLMRLAARYPQLFIQAGAGQIQNVIKTRR